MSTERAMTDSAAVVKVAHMRSEWLSLSENWLYRLVTCLPSGTESHVVCERTLNLDQFRGPAIHVTLAVRWMHFLAYQRGIGRSVRRLARSRTLRAISADVIHSHFGPSGWENLGLARRMRVPHVVSFYGYDVSLPDRHDTWRSRYQELFDQASVVLCEGPHMAGQIVARGARQAQMRLFHLGIELDKFPYRPRTWTSAEPLRVLIAGRFVEKKGCLTRSTRSHAFRRACRSKFIWLEMRTMTRRA